LQVTADFALMKSQILRCGAAAVMLLSANEGTVMIEGEIHRLFACAHSLRDTPQAVHFLSVGLWCSSRHPLNHASLLRLGGITHTVRLCHQVWARLCSARPVQRVASSGPMVAGTMDVVDYQQNVHACEWLLAALYMLVSDPPISARQQEEDRVKAEEQAKVMLGTCRGEKTLNGKEKKKWGKKTER
jgi:hypothetical protein